MQLLTIFGILPFHHITDRSVITILQETPPKLTKLVGTKGVTLAVDRDDSTMRPACSDRGATSRNTHTLLLLRHTAVRIATQYTIPLIIVH
jgi:hypothetical protein